MSRVTKFPTPPEPEQEPVATAHWPDAPTVESMVLGKPLQSIVVLTINTDGDVSHYMDGVSTVEAIGMVEMLKHAIFLADMGYNEE